MNAKVWAVIVAGIVVLTMVQVGFLGPDPPKYIRGEHGSKCYVEGSEHKNINLETALYFNSLELCQKDLKH